MFKFSKIVVFSIIGACLILSSCGPADKNKKGEEVQTMKVELKPSTEPLFFSGTLQPISITSVISPVNGNVMEILFNYGEEIKKDQTLIRLISEELNKEYQESLSSYLTKKEKYNDDTAKMVGTLDLHKAQIISDTELISERAGLHDSYLAFIQARDRLQKVLKKTSLSSKELEQLAIGDAKAVEKALTQPITDITIVANLDGIALQPAKSGNGKETVKEITVGTEVKAGQVVSSIGDLSGLSVDLDVNEININNIHPGLKATVTGNGFPYTLEGYVKSTSYQANLDTSGGALPLFHVKIVVPKLTEEQRKVIHVGMSAKVQINIESPPEIIIPIPALKLVNGATFVSVKDIKTGDFKDMPVVAGATTIDSVVIKQGLKAGDEIVIGH